MKYVSKKQDEREDLRTKKNGVVLEQSLGVSITMRKGRKSKSYK